MLTIFLNSFARSRGAILGWGLSLGALGLYLMPFYDRLAEQQEALKQLLTSYPPELMAFFGDMTQMFTPEGYLSIEFFSYMPLILGIFVVLGGSGLLANDEENGTLDLLLAYPLNRTSLFVGRGLAFLATTISILGLMWLGLVVGMQWSSIIDLRWDKLLFPFASLLAVLSLFGSLALMLSMVLPARRLAAATAGLTLVASFFLTALARNNEDLKEIARFSPLNYYQSGNAIGGLNGEWFFGLLGVAILFALVAWWRFERRDIRVAGEGAWRLPAFFRLKPAPTKSRSFQEL